MLTNQLVKPKKVFTYTACESADVIEVTNLQIKLKISQKMDQLFGTQLSPFTCDKNIQFFL